MAKANQSSHKLIEEKRALKDGCSQGVDKGEGKRWSGGLCDLKACTQPSPQVLLGVLHGSRDGCWLRAGPGPNGLPSSPTSSSEAKSMAINFAETDNIRAHFTWLETTMATVRLKQSDVCILSLLRSFFFSPFNYILYSSQKEMIFHRQK